MLSSGAWQPDADGAYYIDRSAVGFDRILEYLRSGKLSVKGLRKLEEECIYSNLDYFLIPYKRQWHYTTQQFIRGLAAHYIFELKDGRFCAVQQSRDIILCNLNGSAIVTMKGHTAFILKVIMLHDSQLCSCSFDMSIKVWNIDSGLCEHTLTGHTSSIFCIMQLSDGRVCSGSRDKTIRIWNIATGICEMTMNTQNCVHSLAQLPDGRICCGVGNIMSIRSLSTGECELSWMGHNKPVNVIVCIDASTVCTCSDDTSVKVWNISTGACERTLKGHTAYVRSLILMHDGRLCSRSLIGIFKLWNLQTGECEKTLSSYLQLHSQILFQLNDGRLVCSTPSALAIWS